MNETEYDSTIVTVVGWTLISGLVGMLWLAQAKPSEGQATAPAAPQVITAPSLSDTPRILKFTLTLSSPDDLKVRQGDFVNNNQVLADRTRQRQQLLAQQQKTGLSLQRIQAQQVLDPPPPLPVPPIKALPSVSYAPEESAIAGIQEDIDLQTRKLDLLQTLPPDQVPPAMREHEDRILEQLYRDLEAAQGTLKQSQEERAYQEYEYSLALARRAEEENQQRLSYNEQRQRVEQQRRDREFQIAQLEAQIQDINNQLADLSTVRSPYSGTIRRIKWVGQSDNTLTVEITLAVGSGPGDAVGGAAPAQLGPE